ncbi:DNA-processing protein DprA [Paremcibacter congregatus]|uniref:DNA-processing protein DprA n=1 Tax=Paremcibacter congregatus TaxID=2043170 RepID=UPI0030ED2E5D
MSDKAHQKDLSDAEKLARLRLIRTENVGPVTFRHLIARYGSAAEALDALPGLARKGGRKKPLIAARQDTIQQEIDHLHQIDGHLIIYGDTLYSRPLMAIEDAPPVLMGRGHPHLLDQKAFAIVGARNCSAIGTKLAGSLARKMGAAGYVISSGMARGIDAAAHLGALDSGTIAVLAGGVDVIYPRENTALYEDIANRGLVLSEMPLGTQPQARHFPPRNRIISGLAAGVLVIEATQRSGTLITARLALEQGREVFAVPGSPLDPRAKGPNSLLRQGANLVEDVEDILDVLRMNADRKISEPTLDIFTEETPLAASISDRAIDEARPIIRDKLSVTPTAIDELIRLCDFPPAVVQTVLLELELAGEIDRYPGNRVAFSATTR